MCTHNTSSIPLYVSNKITKYKQEDIQLHCKAIIYIINHYLTTIILCM